MNTMSKNKVVGVRLPLHLLRACQRAAGTVSVSLWLRGLAERETGVEAGPMLSGVSGLPAKRRREIASEGGRAKAFRRNGLK